MARKEHRLKISKDICVIDGGKSKYIWFVTVDTKFFHTDYRWFLLHFIVSNVNKGVEEIYIFPFSIFEVAAFSFFFFFWLSQETNYYSFFIKDD